MKWSNSVGGVSPFYGSPLIRRYVNVSRQCNNPQQLPHSLKTMNGNRGYLQIRLASTLS